MKSRFTSFFTKNTYVSKNIPVIILTAAIFVYILYFTWTSFLRHENFYTGRYDLGNMDQVVWNTMQGRIFQSNSSLGIINSRLSGHADFILILMTPLYFLWSDPRMLLATQSVTIAFGAIFIYLIARKIIHDRWLSLTVSFIFLLNPSIQYANLYDFHPVTLATTFLLGAFYFFITKKYLLFLIFCILAGITKEQVWLIVSIFGVFFLFPVTKSFLQTKKLSRQQRGQLLMGLILFCSGFLLFYYLISHAIPQARGNNHFALEYYAEFGSSPSAIIRNILTNPGKVLFTFFQETQRDFLYRLLAPLGFLPLLSPHLLLFTGPDFLISLLSKNIQLRQIYYHYTATITPFLFIATIFSLRQLLQFRFSHSKKVLGIYLLATALFSAYSFGPLPGAKNPNIDMITKPLVYKDTVHKYLRKIPKNKTVAATNNLGAHLSERQQIYTIPIGVDKADIIVFLLNDRFAQPSLAHQKQMVEDLKKSSSHTLLFSKEDFFLFEKKGNTNQIKKQ